ncbi:NADH dehydrogenase [ubiquinone] 1 beta subcomplex subunit 9-like [Mercenaria mercenaria]|uniref:NADH dehydrogenase [ubiquinone] 1 beta subcomplex subunit 9-like n=1 Tax=Mercenaria mercenaria TaxID=6596 RepID=UPI00234F934E|nr:NADH dehydrogenase [ubiquinone] 1 beta subcomplex subunit 9-like [Mercenaria mercenaria]
MATNYLRTSVQSHGKKVCSLYKRACREIEATIFHRPNKILEQRYQQVLLRDRFDKNKHLEPFEAKQALEEGERELYLKSHPKPLQFTNSPGGTNYGREPPDPDWVCIITLPFYTTKLIFSSAHLSRRSWEDFKQMDTVSASIAVLGFASADTYLNEGLNCCHGDGLDVHALRLNAGRWNPVREGGTEYNKVSSGGNHQTCMPS